MIERCAPRCCEEQLPVGGKCINCMVYEQWRRVVNLSVKSSYIL